MSHHRTDHHRTRAARLREIADEIDALIGEAADLVAGTAEESRADAYWIPHLRTALGGHGRAMSTMRETADDLDAAAETDD